MNDLQQNADKFIQTAPYFGIIRAHGPLYFTGSYFLKTMTWRDLDLQLGLQVEQDPKEILSIISASLIKEKGLQKLKFIDFLNYPHPPMTSGLCLSLNAFDENIQDFWKIDIWGLDPLTLQENQKIMHHLKEKMTPEHHALIMAFKNEWTMLYGRPPKMASYSLYQAIILENLQEKQEIEAYLRSKGVKI